MKFCNVKFYNIEFINRCFITELEHIVVNNNINKISKARLRDVCKRLEEIDNMYLLLHETDFENMYHKDINYTYIHDVFMDYVEEYDKRNGACKYVKDVN